MDKKQAALSRIEWESFTDKIEIKKIKQSELIPKGSECIEIWRDDAYKLQGKIVGSYSGKGFMERDKDEGIAGTAVPGIEIEGSDYYGRELYKLSHCYIGNISSRITNLDSMPEMRFEAYLKPYRIKQKYKNEKDVRWLTEWYLNGPSGSFIFPRSTDREVQENYIRKRFNDEEIKFPATHQSEHTRDFAFIELQDRSFIIQAVPKYMVPKWSNSIAIEYRQEWGGIPNEDERDAISEIVGFILGKHLLNVGYTKFNELGYPLEKVAKDPWGDNVVSKCQDSALFPIDIDNYQKWGIIESLLGQLIPQYLLLRSDFNLKQALWSYWVALDLPIGVNLPILSAGVETIAKSWFKTNKSKTKGVYLHKKEYEKLLLSDFNSIEEKLKDNVYQARISNKIRNAYNMSANERLDFFFSEIELPIGDIEAKALRGRNSMAHGDLLNEEEIDKMINLTRTFQTLFHRIILKILGYDGPYIDRSTVGWPERHINEHMQGPID